MLYCRPYKAAKAGVRDRYIKIVSGFEFGTGKTEPGLSFVHFWGSPPCPQPEPTARVRI